MGQPKALLPWQGTSLLEHQVSALRSAGAGKVVVVVGHQPEPLIKVLEEVEGATWVVNPDYMEGKTTSIKAGVGALGAEKPDTLLILNVDQPRSADTVRYLLQEHRAGKGLITIPEYRGKGGHPILLDPSLLDELRSIEEATLGIKAVVQRHQDSVRRVAMDNPEVLWDLNTPEEYQAALKTGG